MLQGLLSKHMVETLSQNIIIATVGKMRVHKLGCCQAALKVWPADGPAILDASLFHVFDICIYIANTIGAF